MRSSFCAITLCANSSPAACLLLPAASHSAAAASRRCGLGRRPLADQLVHARGDAARGAQDRLRRAARRRRRRRRRAISSTPSSPSGSSAAVPVAALVDALDERGQPRIVVRLAQQAHDQDGPGLDLLHRRGQRRDRLGWRVRSSTTIQRRVVRERASETAASVWPRRRRRPRPRSAPRRSPARGRRAAAASRVLPMPAGPETRHDPAAAAPDLPPRAAQPPAARARDRRAGAGRRAPAGSGSPCAAAAGGARWAPPSAESGLEQLDRLGEALELDGAQRLEGDVRRSRERSPRRRSSPGPRPPRPARTAAPPCSARRRGSRPPRGSPRRSRSRRRPAAAARGPRARLPARRLELERRAHRLGRRLEDGERLVARAAR